MKIDIILPCYNEKKITKFLNHLHKIRYVDKNIKFKFIVVDDGSEIQISNKIQNEIKEFKELTYIKHFKNLGKEEAIYSGLCEAKNEYFLIMDTDGQHPIEKINDFIKILQNDRSLFAIIGVKEDDSQESYFRKFLSFYFSRFLSILTGKNFHRISDFILGNSIVRDMLINNKRSFTIVRYEILSMPIKLKLMSFKARKETRPSKFNLFNLINLSLKILFEYTNILKFLLGLFTISLIFLSLYLMTNLTIQVIYGIAPVGYPTVLVLVLLTLLMTFTTFLMLLINISKQRRETCIKKIIYKIDT